MIKELIVQNWANVLVLLAFAVLLKTTVFLDNKTILRMYVLIIGMFVFSMVVFSEFYLADTGDAVDVRFVLMAIRYSTTPFIIAFIIYTLAKNVRWFIFIPAITLAALDIISIFTGIIFALDSNGTLQRGLLGYLPYITVGGYSALLVYMLFKRSNKQYTEIFPIVFLCFAFLSGLILPFILGKDYSQIFCVTITIAVFVYYVFSILQMTEKDALTGLLNRQSFYASVSKDPKEINAVVTIDMNGLKAINDSEGHAAGDTALETLAFCFTQASETNEMVYRLGGDEFVIVCRRKTMEDVTQLIDRIQNRVSKTSYSCAIGYSFRPNGPKNIDDMLKESDAMMYANKKEYYQKPGNKKYRE
ncbi:MAG: GGDEF domain-containing protein [Eubacterium sp.]|nr:GGDEF domain-containing protein [Eubacterium sp.]